MNTFLSFISTFTTIFFSSMKLNYIIPFFIVLLHQHFSFSQNDNDALFLKNIYNHTLSSSNVYENLRGLCKNVGPRLSGSEGAEKGVNYTKNLLEGMNLDSVFLVPCEVPHWVRGEKEFVRIQNGIMEKPLNCTSLGNSISTNGETIKAQLIEVFSLDTLEKLGEAKLKDKIVFFNRPLDPTLLNTGFAYGRAVDQRVYGPTKAAKYGAKAALVRSMTTLNDDLPHTGVTVYDSIYQIPALAISTNDANYLSKMLGRNPELTAEVYNESENLPKKESFSVVGEIRGSEFPDEIILVGGHLDSWDLGEGAHDDGTGCVQAIQVLETLKALDYKPKRTIRCVMFMNEENGLAGGLSYAEHSNNKKEFHLAAIESDAGGFTPRGFTCTADESVFINHFKALNTIFEPLESFDLYLKKGGGGADINPLKSQKGILIGFKPDNQRYFDLHHTKADVFENVNKRELELGAAAMTSLVYLIDQYGI